MSAAYRYRMRKHHERCKSEPERDGTRHSLQHREQYIAGEEHPHRGCLCSCFFCVLSGRRKERCRSGETGSRGRQRESRSPRRHISGGVKKKHHPVRWVILLVLVLVAVYLYRNWPGTGTEEVSYLPATATTQDLTTSDSFTGAIAAVDSQSVVSAISGAKVIEVDVEEGDMVEAGDVIAKLDTTSVEQQIRELQVGEPRRRPRFQHQQRAAADRLRLSVPHLGPGVLQQRGPSEQRCGQHHDLQCHPERAVRL